MSSGRRRCAWRRGPGRVRSGACDSYVTPPVFDVRAELLARRARFHARGASRDIDITSRHSRAPPSTWLPTALPCALRALAWRYGAWARCVRLRAVLSSGQYPRYQNPRIPVVLKFLAMPRPGAQIAPPPLLLPPPPPPPRYSPAALVDQSTTLAVVSSAVIAQQWTHCLTLRACVHRHVSVVHKRIVRSALPEDTTAPSLLTWRHDT